MHLMKKIFIVLLVLFTSLAQAGSFSSFYSHCILKKAGNFNYQIEQVDSSTFDIYNPSGFYQETSHNLIAGFIRGTTRIFDEARNVVSVLNNNDFIKGKKIRDWTIQTIKQEINQRRLNNFEKASLVNCAVFMLVNYKSNLSTKLGSVLEIYEKGEGICTEMTAVALDLGRAVGLKVRSVISNEDHNWPEYLINGTWYILDPTANNFIFLESLKK
jgi:hypothetical protein